MLVEPVCSFILWLAHLLHGCVMMGAVPGAQLHEALLQHMLLASLRTRVCGLGRPHKGGPRPAVRCLAVQRRSMQVHGCIDLSMQVHEGAVRVNILHERRAEELFRDMRGRRQLLVLCQLAADITVAVIAYVAPAAEAARGQQGRQRKTLLAARGEERVVLCKQRAVQAAGQQPLHLRLNLRHNAVLSFVLRAIFARPAGRDRRVGAGRFINGHAAVVAVHVIRAVRVGFRVGRRTAASAEERINCVVAAEDALLRRRRPADRGLGRGGCEAGGQRACRPARNSHTVAK